MKLRAVTWFLTLGMTVVATLAYAGENSLVIDIQVPRKVVSLGEDIPLYILFANHGTNARWLVINRGANVPVAAKPNDLRIAESERQSVMTATPGFAEAANYIMVMHADGTPVERTAYGDSLYNNNSSTRMCRMLRLPHLLIPAGESLLDSTMLNRIYDMSSPGTYLVRVEHELRPIEEGSAITVGDEIRSGDEAEETPDSTLRIVESNTISIRIK